MFKWGIMLCILIFIALSFLGCTWATKESPKGTMIRCPKCGAFYSTKEGAETFEWMRGELKDTRR